MRPTRSASPDLLRNLPSLRKTVRLNPCLVGTDPALLTSTVKFAQSFTDLPHPTFNTASPRPIRSTVAWISASESMRPAYCHRMSNRYLRLYVLDMQVSASFNTNAISDQLASRRANKMPLTNRMPTAICSPPVGSSPPRAPSWEIILKRQPSTFRFFHGMVQADSHVRKNHRWRHRDVHAPA